MSNNYQSGNPQGGNRQKKEIFNQWQAIGVLRPFKEGDSLKFKPWKNGGVLNALISIVEPIGVDENGSPKTRKFTMKCSIKTNKNITAQQLQSIAPGTKVRVVARLILESYADSRQQQVTSVCADIYVLEILEVPMQNYQQSPQYPPQYGQYPQGPQMTQPQQPQYYPPQGQQPPAPQYPAYPGYPGYPGQQMAQPQQPPQYQPQSQPQPQAQPPQYYQPQGQPVPPYYQQPTGQPMGQPIDIDDLPD